MTVDLVLFPLEVWPSAHSTRPSQSAPREKFIAHPWPRQWLSIYQNKYRKTIFLAYHAYPT